jgi:pilus assembly protein Flp/PilA
MRRFLRWIRGEEGQGLVEYGLIIALVALAVAGTLLLLGGRLTAIFQNIVTQLGG